jgi:hypothetical protein
MKKRIYSVMGVVMLTVATLSSCDKGFEEINTDPINISETTPDKLLAPVLVNSLTAGMQRNRNFNNELMQVTVSQSDGDGTVFRYEFRRTFADYLWNNWFVQLNNLKDMEKLATQPATLNKSYQGISLVLQCWLFANLSDTYGDIPYFEAAEGKSGILEPKFDTQKEIYQDMFKKLEAANTLLTAGQSISVISDPVYKGDVAKWRKFCNSLYLRLLLRTSGKADLATSNIAKIKQIVDTAPTTYPIMASNADVATVKWTGELGNGSYVNPYVNGVRAQDFRAPAIASFFIDHLIAWQDPRISTAVADGYVVQGVNRLGISGSSGVPSGYPVGGGIAKQAYFYSNEVTVSNVVVGAKSLQQSPLTGILMNYAEVQFILAEAAAKGWITTTTAEAAYNRGVASSINYWVPSFPASGTDPKVITYMVGGDIDWNPIGTLDEKMEQIHLQKYYALFLVDMQQWFEYRRTGHPILPKGTGLRNGGVMPARMTYPVYVQSANPTNYTKAVSVQGPDEINTNVWWQKP